MIGNASCQDNVSKLDRRGAGEAEPKVAPVLGVKTLAMNRFLDEEVTGFLKLSQNLRPLDKQSGGWPFSA